MTFGRNLSELARAGRLDPVVGRGDALAQVLRILCRRSKNNPLLLGEAGVGKTALVEGLAQHLAGGGLPPSLTGRDVVELSLGSLLAGTQFRGDLEKRLQDFLQHATHRRYILFIDEIHLLVVAGRASGMDAANLLKPMLARGELPLIGATTPAEAKAMYATDPPLERRFQPVHLLEPTADVVRSILQAARPALEAHHGLTIPDAAIERILRVSSVPHGSRRNPDRALDLLEEACAAEQLRHAAVTGESTSDDPDLTAVAAAAARLDLFAHAAARARLELRPRGGEARCRVPPVLDPANIPDPAPDQDGAGEVPPSSASFTSPAIAGGSGS